MGPCIRPFRTVRGSCKYWHLIGNCCRRWVICIGLFATMLLAPLFGLSRNLYQAMAVRFVMGMMNGNAAAAKAYIGEAVTKETQVLDLAVLIITVLTVAVLDRISGFRWSRSVGRSAMLQLQH